MKRPTILVIRPDDGFSSFLRESGFEVLNLELIKTESVDDLTELADTIRQIDQYDGIFLTSPVAAEIFLKQLFNGSGKAIRGNIYVLGERSRDVLTGSALNIV
ncbi:MAG TPA: uroporphyrinogen-III synthase, partial [Pyrinomonadaceae bacterium]|nr:uroporphyrinogen-III synthase [Pyrinomonadaceae bacterium]